MRQAERRTFIALLPKMINHHLFDPSVESTLANFAQLAVDQLKVPQRRCVQAMLVLEASVTRERTSRCNEMSTASAGLIVGCRRSRPRRLLAGPNITAKPREAMMIAAMGFIPRPLRRCAISVPVQTVGCPRRTACSPVGSRTGTSGNRGVLSIHHFSIQDDYLLRYIYQSKYRRQGVWYWNLSACDALSECLPGVVTAD